MSIVLFGLGCCRRTQHNEGDKTLADGAFRDLVKLVNLDEPNNEEAKQLARDRRVEIIQRFMVERPRRMEATFAPDGRIVWMADKPFIYFLYIGNHSVLDTA